jgi:hypothetical protein
MGARPCERKALRKNALAAATSRFGLRRKHGIVVPVHGTVQINPSSAHLQIRLVYTPGSADFACIAIPALFELRHIPLDPTHDGRMRKFQFASCHHLDKIAQAELIAKVLSDTQEDHLSVEMTPRKQSLHALQFAHPHHDSTPVNHSTRTLFAICTRARHTTCCQRVAIAADKWNYSNARTNLV